MKRLFIIAGLLLPLALSCAPRESEVKPAAPSVPEVKITPPPAPPKTFAYTESPTEALIPVGPVRGRANGKSFKVKTVIFEPDSDGKWKVKFCEDKVEDPTAALIEGQYIYFELPQDPAAGKVMKKAMAFGDGFFKIKLPGKPGETTSWNADNAWVLEITEWNQKPWNPEADFFQTAGTASGRVAVCYKGYGDFKNSWAAGNFQDAVIRYMGKPPWAKE
jgi:hypothetical protein